MMSNLKKLIKIMIENQDKTAPIDVNRKFVDHSEQRGKKIESIAKEIVKRLGFDSQVKFINKSTRNRGAYAFSVFDNNMKEIILKVQPLEEVDPYKNLMKVAQKMPKEISAHFPKVYKAESLSSLKIENPVLINHRLEDLGYILMEKLDELSGNMFDIVSGQKTNQKIKSLISDRSSFSSFIDEILRKNEKSIIKIIQNSSGKEKEEVKMTRLRNFMISAMYDKELRDKLDEFNSVSTDDVYKAIVKRVEAWITIAQPENANRALSNIGSIVKTEMMSAYKRPIPKEINDDPGPTKKLKGLDKINDVIKKLSNYGIVPSDVHANNIMIRPDTGEIVFSDIGHFQL